MVNRQETEIPRNLFFCCLYFPRNCEIDWHWIEICFEDNLYLITSLAYSWVALSKPGNFHVIVDTSPKFTSVRFAKFKCRITQNFAYPYAVRKLKCVLKQRNWRLTLKYKHWTEQFRLPTCPIFNTLESSQTTQKRFRNCIFLTLTFHKSDGRNNTTHQYIDCYSSLLTNGNASVAQTSK